MFLKKDIFCVGCYCDSVVCCTNPKLRVDREGELGREKSLPAGGPTTPPISPILWNWIFTCMASQKKKKIHDLAWLHTMVLAIISFHPRSFPANVLILGAASTFVLFFFFTSLRARRQRARLNPLSLKRRPAHALPEHMPMENGQGRATARMQRS